MKESCYFPTQDPKYSICVDEDGARLVVTATKIAIPADEPIFITRGKDPIGEDGIRDYFERAAMRRCDALHLDALSERMSAFSNFKRLKPDRMKLLPDS